MNTAPAVSTWPSLLSRPRIWWLAVLGLLWVGFCQGVSASVSISRPTGIQLPREATPVRLLPPVSAAGDQTGWFEGKLTPLETKLLHDGADGRLDDHPLLVAALIASGASRPEEIARYERRTAALVEQLRAALADKPDTGPLARADSILRFLHRQVFRAYQLQQTDLRRTLDEGRYNCVTATVLYLVLAEAVGLEGCGLEMPKHAMVRLNLHGQWVDVETTCAEWFALDPQDRPSPGAPKAASAQPVGRSSALAGAVQPATVPRRMLTTAQLAAMVYYNRGVDLLAEGRFAEAAAANAKALRLDPQSRVAYGNLLATINNWAVDRAARGAMVEALLLLQRGRQLQPDYEPFRLNYRYVACQWSDALCREGQFAQAAAVLCECAEQWADDAVLHRAACQLFRRWAGERFEAGSLSGAWAVFDLAREQLGDSPEWLACEAAEIERWAKKCLSEGRVETAMELYDRGLERLPGDPRLEARRRETLANSPATVSASFGP